MTLPGTQHLQYIHSSVSTPYLCAIHGHVIPDRITDGTKEDLACPHCLEEMEHGEAKAKPQLLLPGETVRLLPAAREPRFIACPWCKEKFTKYLELREHQDICPFLACCTTEKCNREVVGKCVVCDQTYCGEHINPRGLCVFCEQFSPS